MNNREKYKFEDFTLSNYKRLLEIAKEKGFQFILHKDEFVKDRKDVIWRHDVEFTPDVALEMAKIEYALGVKTTYFFQMHCPYYNTFETYYTNLLFKIKDLGHHIGLHFDSHYFNINTEQDLDKCIMIDKQYMENVLGIKIDTFSFHNTNPFILNCKKNTYGGLINVYSNFFKEHYNYCADSTGIWRYDRLQDVLEDPDVQHLQVLTHDGMWSEDVLSPNKRIMNAFQNTVNRWKREYMDWLPTTGNVNVDDEEINPKPKF